MAEPIGALRVVIEASSVALEQGMRRARESVSTNSARMKRALSDVERGFGKLEKSAMRYAKYAAAAAAAGAVYGFARLTKDAIAAADALYDTAQIVGTSAESLSRLQYAAKISGVEVEALTKGMTFLNRTMAGAAAGKKEAVEAFAMIGMSVKDIADAQGRLLPLDTVLGKLADRFASLPDGPQKAAAAVKLFSRSGAGMIPMLNLGAAGMQELATQSDRLGQTIGNDLAAKANVLGDQLEALNGALRGLGLVAGEYLVPRLQAVAKALLDAKMAGKGLLEVVAAGLGAATGMPLGNTELDKAQRALNAAEFRYATLKKMFGMFGGAQLLDRQALPRIEAARAEVERLKALAATFQTDMPKPPGVGSGDGGKSWEEILEDLEALNEKGGKATDQVDKLADAYESLRRSLHEKLTIRGDFEDLKRTTEEIAQIEADTGKKLTTAQKAELYRMAKKIELLKIVADVEQANEAKRQELAERAAQIVADNLSGYDQYVIQLHEIERLMGTIDAKTGKPMLTGPEGAEAVRRLQEGLYGARDAASEFRQEWTAVDDVFSGWLRNATDALTEFAMTGKMAFADFARSVIRDLVRIQVQSALAPMFAGMATAASIAVAGGGARGSMFSTGEGFVGFARGGTARPGSIHEVAEEGPEMLASGGRQYLLMGGQAGRVTPLGKMGAPALNVGAHYSGIGGDEAPAAAAPQSIRIVNVLDPSVVSDWAASPAGEKVILNAIARHATQLKATLRG